MATPENTFIGSVHQHMPPVDELYHMKNHNVYNGGIADVWYSGGRADLWVEYKFIKVPKRDVTVIDLIGGTKPAISALQQDWLLGRHAEGRAVGVLVGCKEGGVWLPGDTWNTTYTAGIFRGRIKTRRELAALIVSLVD